MSLTPQEIEAAPKITLGGKEYPIPLLVPRQQRVVIPRLLQLFKDVSAGGQISMTNLDTAKFNDIYEIVHTAITRAQPEMKFEEFLDLDAAPSELIASLNTIARQTGLIKQAAPGVSVPGEAAAASLPIGTVSSQE